MRETAAGHRLVLDYLRQLDAALKVLPVRNARELREQVTAHLEEAVPPGASDEAVTRILRQLGSPHDLASEAAAAAGRRPWPARLGWRAWALTGAAVLAVAAVISYLVVVLSTGPLVTQGLSEWWYPQDATRAVMTSADGLTQSTVPIRPGQRQGFMFQLFNYTHLTQTVLGTTLEFGPAGGTNLQAGLSSADPDHGGYPPQSLHYALPVSIPPGQSRDMRVIWTSRGCLEKGAESGTSELTLQVRVGWITRTEVIQLNQGWYLGPGKGPCP